MSDEETKETGLIEFEKTTAELTELFTSDQMTKDVVSKIREKVMVEFSDDVSTAKARRFIASTAAKVSKTKIVIDDAGKKLVADLKDLPKRIDASRKEIRDALDTLKEEVRKPLTDWEADQEREKALEGIRQEGITEISKSFAAVIGRSSRLIEGFEITEPSQDFYGPRYPEALEIYQDQKKQIADYLKIVKDAEEVTELKRQNDQREREEKIRVGAESKAKADAELQVLRAKESEERAVKAKADAEVKAKADAEAHAKYVAEEQERATKAKLAAEERAKVEAFAAKERQERAVKEAEDRERKRQDDEKKAVEAEQRRLEADKVLKMSIAAKIVPALIAEGLDEKQAKQVSQAIFRGRIPNVTIVYSRG